MKIEPMTGAHAAVVLAIYQAGIDEGNATFETPAPFVRRAAGGTGAARRR
jgi:L-amino acid N-acyltransferase YncA